MSYRIDLTPNASYTETVSVSQDDVGREIAVDLYLDGTAYTPTTGTTITMQGTKPSGLGYTITGTASGSTVTFLTTLEMTQEAGRFASEIVLTNGNTVIGTANFALYVEKNPHPENTIDGTGETMQNLTVRMDALEDDVAALESATDVPAGYVPTADGQDGWSWQEQEGGGVPTNVRQAILTLFESAAYAETGLTDEIAVVESWAEEVTALTLNQTSISISGSSTVQLVATTVPTGKTVTWASSDTTIATVSASGLVTGVSNGSVTITASCGDKRATCTATVSGFATLVSISAVYTQSGTVYDTDSLDDLKADLVVTAHYGDGTTARLANTEYTLSGTLATGTSVVAVSYGDKTTTFNVTVTDHLVVDYTLDALSGVSWTSGHDYNESTGAIYEKSNTYCTDKFTTQDCTYTPTCSDSTSSTMKMFFWDSNDNYLGYKYVTGRTFSRIQLKPNYKYAISLVNSSTFDSSLVTMIPTNKTSTAVSEFSLSLSDYVNDITSGNNCYEIIVTSAFNDADVTTSNLANAINRMSDFGLIGVTIGGSMPLTISGVLRVGLQVYSGNIYLQLAVVGVSSVAEMQSYITSNNVVITFNY